MENKVTLIGDIVKIGERRTLSGGAETIDFMVRTWSIVEDGRTFFEYHPVQGWGKSLDKAKDLIQLNRVVRIDGTITHQSWEDRHGQKRRKTLIRAIGIKPVKMEIPPLTELEKKKHLADPAQTQTKLNLQDAGE